MVDTLEEQQMWTVGHVPPYSTTALRFIHNNNELTSLDVELISDDLARGKQSLTFVDAEIASVQDSMHQLSKKLKELDIRRLKIIDFVDDHRRMISPFRTSLFPPEIMAEIFAHAAELNVTDNPKHGIWRFGRVCSSWRSALLAHARLWSRISIFHSNKRSLPAIIVEMLSRSRGAPLDIVLSFPTSHSGPLNDLVILPILAVSKRWRSLTIYGGSLDFLTDIRGNVPHLQQMTFVNTALLSTFDSAQVAPSLTDVRIYNSRVNFHNLRLPWSQLRSCTLHCSEDPSVQFEILRRCKNLWTFSFGPYSREATSRSAISTDIITVALRRLTLAKPNSSHLLPNLKLPSLKSLSIDAAFADDNLNRRLTTLIERSNCSLSTLEVDVKSDDWGRLARLLSNVPFRCLEKLEISGNVHCKPVADVLTLKAGYPVILPHLTQLLVQGGVDIDKTTESLQEQLTSVVKMARSRWDIIPEFRESVTTLKSFVFRVYTPSTDRPEHLAGILKPLQGLHAQGLIVEADLLFL